MRGTKLSTSATLTCAALRPTLALTVLAGVALGCLVLGVGRWLGRREVGQFVGGVLAGFDGSETALDFGITGSNLSREKVEQFERLFGGRTNTHRARSRSRL